MRLQIVATSGLLGSVVFARVLLKTGRSLAGDIFLNQLDVTSADSLPLLWRDHTNVVTLADTKWDKAVLSGRNLWAGMHSDDRKASFLFRTDPHTSDPTLQTVQSPYDGDMKELWKKWGYKEDDAGNAKIDKECDFEAYHKLKRAFEELGVKTESKGKGGPNECVQVDHKDGPNVLRDADGKLPSIDEQKYVEESCGKEYRVS